MEKKKQMSETIRLGLMLALSGGFMDAYSYIERGEVFANAQTGNMLLFGVNLSEGNYKNCICYLLPVLAFAVGIILAETIHLHEVEFLHWRQISVLAEAVILVGVAFLPQSANLIANSLTSFACGIQVESFRAIRGNGIATTMCIGNMRSGTQNLCEFFHSREKQYLKKAGLYYGIILCFVVGAVIGNVMIRIYQEKAILCCSMVLFLAYIVMYVDYEKKDILGGKI